MALVDLIKKDVVKVPLVSQTKPEIIDELIDILYNGSRIKDREDVREAINKREELGSTGLEFGIAVPHAKTNAVGTLTVAIGISPAGVDFDALDGKPSKLFFLILAAPNQSGPHIEALAEIAKLSKSRTFLTALMNAKSADEVLDLFRLD